MPDFRKTLPLPPPGRSVSEALEESVRRQPRKSVPPIAERKSSRDLRRSKPGRKTLRPAPEAEDGGASNDSAPSWMLKARTLSSALEEALRSGQASAKIQGCIERAHAAWSLDSVSPQTVARVAHLAHRAHDAIRGTSRAGLENAYADCARLLHLGLPNALRRRLPLDIAVELVRNMRREADSWVAVVEATMLLVGWTDAARARAAEAVRLALEEYPPESTHDQG